MARQQRSKGHTQLKRVHKWQKHLIATIRFNHVIVLENDFPAMAATPFARLVPYNTKPHHSSLREGSTIVVMTSFGAMVILISRQATSREPSRNWKVPFVEATFARPRSYYYTCIRGFMVVCLDASNTCSWDSTLAKNCFEVWRQKLWRMILTGEMSDLGSSICTQQTQMRIAKSKSFSHAINKRILQEATCGPSVDG